MADRGTIASIVGAAGAGFRLSLLLNAVGAEMTTADLDIQAIAKEISLFSLALKQVGLIMEATESVASPSAADTAKKISKHSEMIFTEVKEMVEVSQKRDEQGNFRSITVARRVAWCFKKRKVQYLIGQLETLKLSLSIMLQVLQLGKYIAITRQNPTRPIPRQQDMRQERAEIQNMVVVRNWTLVNLQKLYQVAENEELHPTESPPPSSDGIAELDGDPRLTITGSAHGDSSKAMVKYHETPLNKLDASMNMAIYRPNKILRTTDNNVVDYLLNEWTSLSGTKPRPRHKQHKYDPHYETDTESDSEYESERSKDTRGRYIEGSKSGARKVKNVHFRARVEDGSEDSDASKPRRKPPKRHLLRSDDEDSSTASSSDDELSPLPNSRRSSASSNTSRRQEHDHSPKNHRFIPAGAPNPSGSGEIQPGRPNPRSEIQPGRPSSRGGPPSPVQSRPMPIPVQSWQGQPLQSLGLRPPPPYSVPPPPHRTPSGSPYMTRPQGYPPPNPQGRPFYPPPAPSVSSHSQRGSQRSQQYPRKERRSERERKEKPQERKEGGFNLKRGLLGAGAAAGIMDILEGLSGI